MDEFNENESENTTEGKKFDPSKIFSKTKRSQTLQ